ncbi:hypothetical protein P153DRAFT_213877 [Dothidotthia symphoricarpi CBS 119687]|uniref:Uncharacterized protein n=1 Tax=Dothidotthia symphoricarpi CBS 119687 TaxID=1392245 RepID=A0A6A6AIF8_9PLEO|nr:uncharacterized protein P153DRAFT_213877 [Dothidotthia symphoricarpi CBS 119687]KAF2130211.1 hypothetical protein P153DRAFT_213877 [Dothidotthia symphoricarpi CBS 119687]
MSRGLGREKTQENTESLNARCGSRDICILFFSSLWMLCSALFFLNKSIAKSPFHVFKPYTPSTSTNQDGRIHRPNQPQFIFDLDTSAVQNNTA